MEGVYILLGPEKGLKEDFIKETRSKLGPCDVSKFYAFDDFEGEFYAQLNNNDLFADHKLVILDEAQEIKTADRIRPLVEYIKNPSECATLIILSTELYLKPEIMGAVQNQKEQILKFYEMFDSQKNTWLASFFRRGGLSISPDAINAILEKVENNIQEFENTCSQMIVYFRTIPGKTSVTYDDIEDFLSHTREENEFSLFAYISKGKLESAIECLQTMIRINDFSQIAGSLCSRLAMYFRRAMSVQLNVAQGMGMSLSSREDQSAFQKKFFDSDRPISMPKDKEIYRSCCQRYRLKDMERILVTLSEYDIKIKESATVLQQTVMERCLVDIMVHKGRHSKKLSFASL